MLAQSPNDNLFQTLPLGDLFVEIWGYSPADKSTRARGYNKKGKTLEARYKNLGLTLVSIEKEMFLQPYCVRIAIDHV